MTPNLKGIGKHQREVITLLKEGKGRRVTQILDYGDWTNDISVTDGLDDHMRLSLSLFQSLLDRNIISIYSTFEHSLNVVINKYKLNNSL